MWLRAFTILFELRARVSSNLKTTIDINEYLGIRPGQTITINYNSDCSDDNYPRRAFNQNKQEQRRKQKGQNDDKPPKMLQDKSALTNNLKDFEKKKSQKKLALPEMDIDNEVISVGNKRPAPKKSDRQQSPTYSDLGRSNIELDSDLSTNRMAHDTDKVFQKLSSKKPHSRQK